MTVIIQPKPRASFTVNMLTTSPYELYLEQVGGISDSIRAAATGTTYIMPQFGGLGGQWETISDMTATRMISFDKP